MFKLDKQQFMLSLKDSFNKDLAPITNNLSTILTFTSVVAIGVGAWTMWHAVPQAQEAIEEKKERDNTITKLEAAAVAAPYMWKPITAFGIAAGAAIGADYISRSRLAATTALLATAIADKKKLQAKFEEYSGKDALQKAKKEIFEETHGAVLADDDGDGDPTVYGTDHAFKNQDRKNSLNLNRLYRVVLEDNREFWSTPLQIKNAEKYIRANYGKTAITGWKGKPFSLNTFFRLLNVDYGPYGDNHGYSDGTDFKADIIPAYDSRTGEMYMLMYISDMDPDWDKPFK